MDHRISAIELDEQKRGAAARRAIEQEREVAIYDLLEGNCFKPKGSAGGPYRLTLSVEENRLVFDITLRRRHARMAGFCCRSRRSAASSRIISWSAKAITRRSAPRRRRRSRRSTWAAAALHDEGTELLHEAARRQDRNRFRHRAPAVHPDLRAASEGLTAMTREPEKPASVLFACTLNAVRSPMAAALMRHLQGRAIYVEIGRGAGRRARSPGGGGDGGNRHRARQPPAPPLRGPGGRLLRSGHHAVARGPAPGPWT